MKEYGKDHAKRRVRTAFPLGVEIAGGGAVTLIPAGAEAPLCRSMSFTTATDGQRAVEVRVVRLAPDMRPARMLGRFLLSGIERGRAGDPRIRIAVSLDESGILRAWARDAATGAVQRAVFAGALGAAAADALSVESLAVRLLDDGRRWDGGPPGAGRNVPDARLLREIGEIAGHARASALPGEPSWSDSAVALSVLAGELECARAAGAVGCGECR